MDKYGVISDIAGKGQYFYTDSADKNNGDGSKAINAYLDPKDIAVDNKGNIYVVDGFNNRIRKVDNNGLISTIAGNGSINSYSNNQQATKVGISELRKVKADNHGNIFFLSGNKLLKVDNNGLISTVIENNFVINKGKQITFYPSNIEIDSLGNIYFINGNYVYKFDNNKKITKIAGTSIENKDALKSFIYNPSSLVIDSKKNIYFTVNSNIYKIDKKGFITNFLENNKNITSNVSFLHGLICIDSNDNIYGIKDYFTIIKIDKNGLLTYKEYRDPNNFENTMESSAFMPYSISVDSKENIYISDWLGKVIKIDKKGESSDYITGFTLKSLSLVNSSSKPKISSIKNMIFDENDNMFYIDLTEIFKKDKNNILTKIYSYHDPKFLSQLDKE